MATSASALANATSNTDRFYTVVKSINQFDINEVKGVVTTLLAPTERETCFIATYYRARGNVETLLKMDRVNDFQAIAMLARSLFELAVDIRLLEITQNGWIKMLAHSDFEKLRLAKKIVALKATNPDAQIDTTVYNNFIARQQVRILALQKSIWPGNKSPKHWSGLGLDARAAKLKSPFEQIYLSDYARLSWYVHPGITGIMNVPAEGFIHLCAYAFHLAGTAYGELLLSVIREFKISKVNDKIRDQLEVAKKLPFADTQEQVDALMREIQ